MNFLLTKKGASTFETPSLFWPEEYVYVRMVISANFLPVCLRMNRFAHKF